MDGGAAAETIGVLVQNLINVSKDEISLIRGLKKNAQELQERLVIIQSYLSDAEKKCIDSEAVQKWLKQLENVAFDADNVLDELNYHALHKKVQKLNARKPKVLSCFSSFNRIKMAHKVKQITTNLDSINKWANQLGLESIVVNAPAATPAVFETDSFTLDPIFIGRDSYVLELVDTLTQRAEERKFSIVAVVGMGGMGKTTLTRKVFNHERVRAQFGSLIWVHVSQIFDPIILFKKILASLTSQTVEAESGEDSLEKLQKKAKSDEVEGGKDSIEKFEKKAESDGVESRDVTLKKIHEALKAKTCLLVLDDIWNQDLPKWEDFVNSFSGVTSSMGNGIILTTRNKEVASIVKPFHIHQLNPLSDKECWSIIKAKTFGNREFVPSRFEIIGREIARRCQGLPLAANVVGGVLQNKLDEDEWHLVKQDWIPDVEGVNNISKILRLSYDNLSSPSLKKCFVYCSILPKGSIYKKHGLIELWMAEGFLQCDHINDMESVGNKFVNILLHNSLLLGTSRENCVTMHDLVHDLACSVLGSCKVDDIINSDGINRVRYYRQKNSSIVPKEVAKHLRTLFLEGEVSSIMFSDFESLHVLSLTDPEVVELPDSIRKLIHLRDLNITSCSNITLPEWVGELLHLQTLRINKLQRRKLPGTLKNLINLRHLYFSYGVDQPPEIGRLTSLQTLPYFKVGNEKGYKIDELGSLKYLKGSLVIYKLENVHDKDEAVKANMIQKPNLSSLEFQWGPNREGDERNDESVLEGLQPHPNLKSLTINEFEGKILPLWFRKMEVRDEPQGSWIGLNKLRNITLFKCNECEELPALGHLPNLKSLELLYLSNVKSINPPFYDFEACKEMKTSVFPSLERLVLHKMPKLREWAEVETRSNCQVKLFPHLQHLKISYCNTIPLANIFEIKMPSLATFSINGLRELECLPDLLFYNNHSLSKIQICNCTKLIELPDGLHTLNSLKDLIIENCRNLKWIGNPSGQGRLTSLRSLKIIDCREVIDFPSAMVESLAPSLRKLSLVGLKILPRVLDSLTKASAMAKANSCTEILSFRRLQKLEMDVGIKLLRESSVAIRESVDAILHGCSQSLTDLSLRGMEIWECLPESIQNLTVLSKLELENFGVEELPEWFGNLSSLENLTLYCKNLRCLPSVDAMQRLTNLQYIKIRACSNELHIDSELLSFSHLPIYVGTLPINQPSDLKNALEWLPYYYDPARLGDK